MTDDRVHPNRIHRPPDPDLAEALNATLDGSAPASTPHPELAELLAIARTARATPLDAGEDASPARLDALWDGILRASQPRQVSAPSEAVAVAFHAGPARVPVPRSLGARSGQRRSGLRTVTSWLSMAAVIVVLVGMGSMAWSLRPGGGDHSLLASATSLAVGTASASPSPVATPAWMRWPVPADCDVAPMAHEDYAALMSAQPDISGRSYEVAGVPTQAEAEAAADVARTNAACEAYGLEQQARTTESAATLFFASDTDTRTMSRQEVGARGLEGGMLISATAPAKAPAAYGMILDGDPPALLLDRHHASNGSTPLIAITFDPDNALLLADGRVAIPATALYWSGDSWEPQPGQIDESESFSTVLTILTDASGSWRVDERLTFCPYAGCSPEWQASAQQLGIPIPTLDVPAPWTIPTGTATPVASPAHEGPSTRAT